jgi:hypothetical protein
MFSGLILRAGSSYTNSDSPLFIPSLCAHHGMTNLTSTTNPRSSYPAAALACGLDPRTQFQDAYPTWDEGSQHDVSMWYCHLT